METKISPKVKKLLIFWSRMVGYVCSACVAPITIFATKFGLFSKNVTVVDELGNVIKTPSIKLNGWGIVSCILIFWVLSTIVKEIAGAYPTYSLTKQCLLGVTKTIIPLLCAYFVCYFLQDVIGHIMYCIMTVTICQGISIPLNPLPQWRFEKSGGEDYSSIMTEFTKFVKERSKKGE